MLAHGFRATGVAAAACALVLGLSSASAAGSGAAARNGVVLIDRGGGIAAVNVNGSGVHQLTTPGRFADNSDSDPVASPDGARVAFDRAFGHVYVMNADGSGLRRLGPGIDPEWSPDSRWLAASTFTLDQGLERVYVMKADGSVLRRIGRGDGPSWSPDGHWLAYEGDLRNEESGIYIAHPDGTGKLRLAKSWSYAWSPDGRWLAYLNDAGLSLVDPDTNERRMVLRSTVLGDDADPWGLSWSPDSTRIAFVSKSYGEGPVYVAALDGSKPRRIGPAAYETPVWSPDGTRIAYTTDICCSASGNRVTVIDVSTGHRLMSVHPVAGEASQTPAWSPDGSSLVFLRGNTAGGYGSDNGDLWVVNPDGTGLSQLTTAFPFNGVGDPAWWPGHAAVAADPKIPTVALDTVGRRRAVAQFGLVGADRSRVAVERWPNGISQGWFGIWSGPRRLSRIPGAGGSSVAFAGARLYWASNDRKEAWLYTAARPLAKQHLLRYVDNLWPNLQVDGDGPLVAYTLYHKLWRLRGAHERLLRHERVDIDLLDVNGGRMLLLRGRRLELVDVNGRLLRSFASRAGFHDGALSGRRVVAVGAKSFFVFDARTGHLRAKWRAGAPGVSPGAAFMFGSLLPYSDGSALHVLDVDTGHDLIARIRGVTEPVDAAVTRLGLLYTWTRTYSAWPGRLGLVPMRKLRAALHRAHRVRP